MACYGSTFTYLTVTSMLHAVFDRISLVYFVVNTTDGFHEAICSFSAFLRVELLREHLWIFN